MEARRIEVHLADVDGDTAEDIVVSCSLVDASHPQAFIYYNAINLRHTGYAMAGSRVTLAIDAPASALQPYLLLASSVGSWPGIDLGSDRLPVNFDPTLLTLILNGGAGLFSNFVGSLDSEGHAAAFLNIPPGLPPGLVITAFAEHLDGMWGVFCCQCRRSGTGPVRFFEINARFGGGAPLSIAAGANLPLYLLQEVLDLPIVFGRCLRCKLIREDAFEAGFSFFTPIHLEDFVQENVSADLL